MATLDPAQFSALHTLGTASTETAFERVGFSLRWLRSRDFQTVLIMAIEANQLQAMLQAITLTTCGCTPAMHSTNSTEHWALDGSAFMNRARRQPNRA